VREFVGCKRESDNIEVHGCCLGEIIETFNYLPWSVKPKQIKRHGNRETGAVLGKKEDTLTGD